jgi:hypothetical protein
MVRVDMAQALFERVTTRKRRVVAVKFGDPFSSIFRGLLKNRQRRRTGSESNLSDQVLGRLRQLTDGRFDVR